MINWPRYAKALDMKLAGAKLNDIAMMLGVSRERARQIVDVAAHTLAYRVFFGVSRYRWKWDNSRGEWKRSA